MDTIGFLVGAVVAIGLYLIPTFVGANKRNHNAIMWLNILLGWTFIGWVGALIWALSTDKPTGNTIILQGKAEPGDDVARYARLKQLRDEGIISQDEFMQQVTQLP